MLVVISAGVAKLWLNPPSFEFNWENRWWQIAVNVARGDGYIACKPIYFPFCGPGNDVTAMREPLPVLLFALIALLTDESLMAAAAFVVLVNAATVAATFWLGRELAGTRAGVFAALLWACYAAPLLVFYSQPSGDLLAALAITGGFLYFLRARRTDRLSAWVVAGFLLGLATLSRSALLIIPLVLSLTQLGERGRAAVKHVGVFIAAWMLIVSPWVVRNYTAFGRPVIGSTLSGYYLYRQNYMLPSGHYLRFVTGGEFVPVIRAMITRRNDLRGDENEAEMDQVYREEAMDMIKAEPVRYVVISAYRFLVLWFNWGVRAAYHQRNSAGDYLLIIQHALLLAGGALALRKHWSQAWPLGVTGAAFTLLYMAVMAHITYVLPVIPLLVALTATLPGVAAPGPELSKFKARR
jgi:4-amino-4-deoxy-L-arabinose transferase-like glycosyltransferase